MIIAQITDTHIALDVPDAAQRLADFATAIADINALDPGPDLIVHSGDIVHNGRAEEYAKARAILNRARAPVYVMAGNKDDRAELCAAFSADGYLSPGSDFIQYALDGDPVRLVMLDTVSTRSNKGDFCARRFEAMKRLIGEDSARPVAVFMHHPPFEVLVGPERMHFESQAVMANLRDALQQSGRVTAIFCGHVHRPTDGYVGKIPVTVATALSTTLRKGEYPEHMAGRPIYCVHRFDTSGRLSTETRVAGPRSAVSVS